MRSKTERVADAYRIAQEEVIRAHEAANKARDWVVLKDQAKITALNKLQKAKEAYDSL